MPILPTIGGTGARSLLPVLLLSVILVLPGQAQWKDGEQRTVAYAAPWVDGPEWEGWYWFLGSEDQEDLDPFGADETEWDPAKRLAAGPPVKSRFLRAGDELWDLADLARKVGLLQGEKSWMIYNATTQRLVLHGSRSEHNRMEVLHRGFAKRQPRSVQVDAKLLEVRCPELGGVVWDAKALANRAAKTHFSITTVSSPGRAATTELTVGGHTGFLETTAMIDAHSHYIDIAIAFEFTPGFQSGLQPIALGSGVILLDGHPFYLEIGSDRDPQRTLLLELTCEAQFVDGTPLRRAREFENPRHQPVRLLGRPSLEGVIHELGDGLAIGMWQCPGSFLPSLVPDEEVGDEGTNPFQFGEDRSDRIMRGLPLVDPPPELVAGDALQDVGKLMTDFGITSPAEGWILYRPSTHTLYAKLSRDDLDLVQRLCDEVGIDYPRMVRVALSVFEWEGPLPEPGQIPRGAKRLARLGALGLPGQSVRTVLGRREEEDVHALTEGLLLEVASQAGAGRQEIDLKLAFEKKGNLTLSLLTGAVVLDGRPVIRALGSDGKRQLALLVEAVFVTEEGRREWR